jgi:hypothetical protein
MPENVSGVKIPAFLLQCNCPRFTGGITRHLKPERGLIIFASRQRRENIMSLSLRGIKEKSQLHLDNLNESYWQHMGFALGIFFTLLSAAFLLLIHTLIPAFFECSASNRIHKLSDAMRARQNRTNCQ